MIKIGLTGGIGSGKTTVAKIFESHNIPVYYADERAKKLMVNDEKLVKKISRLFGKKAYTENGLNTRYIAGIVFNNPEKLKELETLVHPVVKKDFLNWTKKQKSDLVVIENAILHHSGMDKLVDLIITVTADKENRINRVVLRDGIGRNEVLQRINNQKNEADMLKKSDIIIRNNVEKQKLHNKVNEIISEVKKMLKKS
jgi:dephospho-CoA kinase